MDIKHYEKLGMNNWQIEVIKEAYRSKISQSDIDKYFSDTRFNHLQMEVILNGLKAGIDVDIYAKPDIDHESMQHILDQRLLDKEKEILENESNEKVVIQEKRINNTKNMIVVLAFIAMLVLLFFLSKDYLIGNFQNLELNLKKEKITIEVGSYFNAKEYVESYSEEIENIQISYPSLDTNRLGTYYLDYIISSPYKVLKRQLEVNIVDTTPPAIELTKHEDTLIREQEFNCMDYIKSYSDNYDKNPVIKCSDNIDWEKDKINITYVILDSSGNKSEESLSLNIKDKPKVTPKPTQIPTPPPNNTNGNDHGISDKPVSKPFLSGVHDVNVTVGTSLNDLVYLLTNGISSSGNISVDYSSVNLSEAGTYTVYYNTSDGQSATATVIVSE